MNEVSQVLLAVEQGDAVSAEKLLPLVFEELRKLAALGLNWRKTAAVPLPPKKTLQEHVQTQDVFLKYPAWSTNS